MKITPAFTFDPPPGHGGWRPVGAAGSPAVLAGLGAPAYSRHPRASLARQSRTICSSSAAGFRRDDPYAGAIVQAKRAAEAANSHVFASLQRMSADPKNQRESLQSAAILANGNQRLTRALTAVALHLAPGVALPRPEFGRFVQLATETLEALAANVETGRTNDPRLAQLRASLAEFSLPEDAAEANPAAPGNGLAHSAAIQFTRFGTELSAMLFSLIPNGAETTAR